jgi:hypothetical protein
MTSKSNVPSKGEKTLTTSRTSVPNPHTKKEPYQVNLGETSILGPLPFGRTRDNALLRPSFIRNGQIGTRR